jgi:hypothetical protein
MPNKLVVSAGVLCLLLGTTASVFAQHEHEGNQQGSHPAPAAHPARPTQQPRAAAPARSSQQSYGGVYHGNIQRNSPTYGGVHQSGVPQHQGQVRSGFVQSRATSWNDEHHTWAQRGGYNGYRIPDARFHSYFGRDHFFRINHLPMVFVGGFPRFQYDGYWVTFVDPWPQDWSPLWYENDDVYLDYTDDGYYLYSRSHPGIGMAVTISF